MRLFHFEAKKLLVHQWGALICVLYLLCQLALLLGNAADNPDAVLYQEGYHYYLEQVSGPYTEEEAAFLEAESQRIAQAKSGLNSLYQEYYAGTITEAELQAQAEEYQEILRYENGFNVVYDQYLYVREGKENRCFLDTNGWAGLLGDGMLDLPLVLAILLLATPVFCREYACKMDALALTTPNGRKSYVWHKVLLVLLTVAVLCLAGAALRCGFYAWRYGLTHGDYTMQSVETFGNSTKQLSLWGAFGVLTALHLGGTLFLTLLVLAAAALSRQYALTVLIPAISILLPWLGLSERLQYAFPLPLPFLLGAGFLQGSSVSTDTLTGEQVTLFQELGTGEIAQLLILSAVVCLLCLWVVRQKNRTALSGGRKRPRSILILALAAALTLNGCSIATTDTDEVNFNSHTSTVYEANGYCVYWAESTLWVEHLETETVTELVRDPLLNGSVGRYLFGTGHYVYYMLEQTDSYAGKLADSTGSVSQFSVIRVNLDTFEETVVYENQQVNTILGLNINEGFLPEMSYSGSFFFSESALYILYGGVRRIDLHTGETTVLDIPTASNVAFDGGYIYYWDNQYALCRLEPDSGELTRWTDVAVYDFCLADGTLYYIDMRQGNTLYAMSTDGTERKSVLNEPLLAVEYDGGTLLITDQNGNISSLNPEEKLQ